MRKYYLWQISCVLKASYVLAIAIAIATLVPVSLAFTPLGQIGGRQVLGTYDNSESSIVDAMGDAQAVYQKNGTVSIPEVKDYHDIIGASVAKRGEAFLFTIDLAGDPNRNQEYETIYRWHIITAEIANSERLYTLMFPNFGPGSNSTAKGWYFAVFDNTNNMFIKQPISIMDMPKDRIEFSVEDSYIGKPAKFVYWVDVSVRLNNTLGEPDYLMDYAP
jgi:hypothetical protein